MSNAGSASVWGQTRKARLWAMGLDSYGPAPEHKASLTKYHAKLRHYLCYKRLDNRTSSTIGDLQLKRNSFGCSKHPHEPSGFTGWPDGLPFFCRFARDLKTMTDQALHAPLTQIIAELARPLAESFNLSLWGIELIFGGRSIVRVYVESDNGVTIDQCAELSRLLALALDVEDAIPGAYALEVSSPGLERIFFTPEQLAGALGQTLEITLAAPSPEFSGRRKFRGVLIHVPEAGHALAGAFTLQVENPSRPGESEGLLPFVFTDLKKARQVHIFPEKVLPGKGGKKKSKADSAEMTVEDDIPVTEE